MDRAITRGARRPLNERQRRLAAKYLPMAKAVAMPLKVSWLTLWDEFESAACMALVEAAEAFEPSRKVHFWAFARARVLGALRDVKRRHALLGYRCDPENAPNVSGTLTPHREGIHIVPFERPVGHEVEALDEVEWWLRKLPRHHAEACREIYVHDRTQKQAAEALGCSQSRIACMHREAMAMLNGSWKAATPPADAPPSQN